jgi:hypothetical protein
MRLHLHKRRTRAQCNIECEFTRLGALCHRIVASQDAFPNRMSWLGSWQRYRPPASADPRRPLALALHIPAFMQSAKLS